ncbi:VP2 [Fall chinook aquareovirus]|uniref:VP2 n=1 Tax=Fall chinook aquareovirus TaxID=1963254 RepID=UPI000994967B|nr:VP2 [Fall chinook aquareovirus]AQU42726.1 VP2 [Fall chinook aquareovirus]
MSALFNALPIPLQHLSQALAGEKPITDYIFSHAADAWHSQSRSSVYSLLDSLNFSVSVVIPGSIFVGRQWQDYWALDGDIVIRISPEGAKDADYCHNSDITPILSPLKSISDYGTLNPAIEKSATERAQPTARMASSFFKLASSQARQVKLDPARMLSFLLVVNATKRVPSGVDTDQSNPWTPESSPALYAIHRIMQHYKVNGQYYAPALIVNTGAVWWIPPVAGKTNCVSVQFILTDLVNLAINAFASRLSPTLEMCAVRMYLAAAATPNYAHALLDLKAIFPNLSLHSMYRNGNFGGKCPRIEWLEPRSNYKFRWIGVTHLHHGLRPLSPSRDVPALEKLTTYGLRDVGMTIIQLRDAHPRHTMDATRFVRDVMSLTSGMYLVRPPTMSVRREYSQTPDIQDPIPPDWWSGAVGHLRYFNEKATGPAKWLYDTWMEAARKVMADPNTHDPLNQAIFKTQFVTPRGGSSAALKQALAQDEVELPDFTGTNVKRSSKIYQVAQLARLPFQALIPAVLGQVTLGIRNQVQRRARSVMPMSTPQQTVSVPHTMVANYINKHMNRSTTSGSAVHDKVIPLLLYASTPPRTVINVDIKACDASITFAWFLSIICGAIHQGFDIGNPSSSYMNVPPTTWYDRRNPAAPYNRAVSGLQTMTQHLARLYQAGFSYKVDDPFTSGNSFDFPTSTFPSGSTATSTEHTANNGAMASYFLKTYVPTHAKSETLKFVVRDMSIQDNYVCQGDDGMLIIPDLGDKRVSQEDMEELIDLLTRYGRGFGWIYDVDHSDSAEYLKMYALFGCRIPNISRHPPIGKEYASPETGEIWPSLINIVMGLFLNGVTDCLEWRDWLRFMWAFACFSSRGSFHPKDGQRIDAQYPWWSFVYLGLPPILLEGMTPFAISPYMPAGDQGFYAVISSWKSVLIGLATVRYPATTRLHQIWGHADVPSLLSDLGVYKGYWAAQLPRRPEPSPEDADPTAVESMKSALSDYLLQDPVLRERVQRGTTNWRRLSESNPGRLPVRVPSLLDVPDRWIKSGRDAEKPRPSSVHRMMQDIQKVSRSPRRGFSRLLELYLHVDVVLGAPIPLAVDPEVPHVAGADVLNDDHWFKVTGLGPVSQSTRRYFDATLFVGKTVSGLDVEAVDATLLRMKILGAEPAEFHAVLGGIGMSDAEAHQVTSGISLANAQNVQLARTVNLAIPSTWMPLDFDSLIRMHTFPRQAGISDHTTIVRERSSWVNSVLRLLCASVAMSRAGPVCESTVAHVSGGVGQLTGLLREWMRDV